MADFQKGFAAYMDCDFAAALREFRPLATQGNKDAQFNLGVMYEGGEGVAQDDVQAAVWYRKSAEQRHSLAQHSLGISYREGLGVPKDYVQAHMWFNLAACRKRFKRAAEDQDKLEELMTPTQIAEGQRLAREWMEKHSK